ncbi:MAG: nicotinate-nucleotide--dimethylbenzimidazole phosphoribosyltransferase [Rhodospirillaceae bacterium]|nr:nicotinate-nucleotide--dimethylbenzimidazole phosphoribosyltransferase [Rhodospirillaceae bacterium]|tara:strand:+ start:807 stop:1856 length:1050 start_codon:yes stop_codon:yes gene_type:complete
MSNKNQKKPIASFDEVRLLIDELPGPDYDSQSAAVEREAKLTKPEGALGKLEQIVAWLAAWQGEYPPKINHPRTAVFAANHGVANLGVSAFPSSVTEQMVQNFISGGAAVNQLCKVFDSDLRVYELALDQPTNDFTKGPAMSEAECAHAMAYGMMAVEPGLDILCLGEMGIGNTTSASALSLALFGGNAKDWVGSGTGISSDSLDKKIKIVQQACELHGNMKGDPLAIFAALGGLELAAIAGAILAARLAKVPVVLDGFACTVAAAILYAIKPCTIDHCLVSHCSVEPGHKKLLGKINKESLLDLGMRLGEGSGATLALGIIRAAIACHLGMATFEGAGVSNSQSNKIV